MPLALILASAPAALPPTVTPWPAEIPRPVGASPIDGADYPAEALSKGEQGILRLGLDVGADGRVSACSVTQSSGSRSLDDATCPMMMARARFTPVRDGSGKPVPGMVVERVTWRIMAGGAPHGEAAPDTSQGPPLSTASLMEYFSRDDYPPDALRGREQGKVSFRLDVGVNGRVVACTILRSSGSGSLDAATCRIARLRGRFAPRRDSAGNALPATMAAQMDWRLPR
jgi:TonB family protein